MLDLKKKRYRDDPTAYMVAADQLEEAGEDRAAALARRQGEVLRYLVEALTPACQSKAARVVVKGELPCGATFRCTVTTMLAILRVRWAAPGAGHIIWDTHREFAEGGGYAGFRFTELHMRRDLIADPARADYLPGRVRELFEEHLLGGLLAKEEPR